MLREFLSCDQAAYKGAFSKKSAKMGLSLKLVKTFSPWTTRVNLNMIVLYSRTYHNVSADALAGNSVDQIEEWAALRDFALIEIPVIWGRVLPFDCNGRNVLGA